VIRYFTQFIGEQAVLVEDDHISDIRHSATAISNGLYIKSRYLDEGDGLK